MQICRQTSKPEACEEEEEEDEDEEEEKKSLKKSLDSLQKTLLEFQEGSGLVASYCERIWNLIHFEEKFLTFLLSALLLGAAGVLWLLGLRLPPHFLQTVQPVCWQDFAVAVGGE